ncbi:helix-turn-helix DNA binding domain protein [Rhodococcus phage Trina]|uniref:Helix-turn-helix DNA binding domain protein n=1 Tax=Rhodococcus phage Trina TaxID=2027905 RepID=A0A2D1A483_9CAUD|nr:helix-turn-helix DNA binding domain protein [Rhodococcus phage Trina]ASZ74956.1 helix-turn-helix DNA binding domain protein [Rhodococcus phage Trina]
MDIPEKLNDAALKAVAECGDQEGVWHPGYVGKFYGGKAAALTDANTFAQAGISARTLHDMFSNKQAISEAHKQQGNLDTEYTDGYSAGALEVSKLLAGSA